MLSIQSISAFHELFGVPNPEHPLISVIEIKPFAELPPSPPVPIRADIYQIAIKKNFKGPVKIKYGQQQYDFDQGILTFMAPGQIFVFDPEKYSSPEQAGWMLLVHPDFLWNTNLGQKIKQHDYFGYSINEALFLSEKEEITLTQMVQNIALETRSNLDRFSHDIIVSQLETLLNFSERYYQRQFLTRRKTSNQLLQRLDDILEKFFDGSDRKSDGLPTVQFLAESLQVSPDYLSGLLKSLTGLNARQHIHEKVIERAKERLSNTILTVNEIAYELGFEHAQSFSKLFRSKTNQTPLDFRRSFN